MPLGEAACRDQGAIHTSIRFLGLPGSLGSSVDPGGSLLCASVTVLAYRAPGEMTVSAEGPCDILQLAYVRPVGEARAEGHVELRHVRIVQ